MYNKTRWDDWRSHCLVLAYPLVNLAIAAAIATILGANDTNSTNWNKTHINIGLMISTGIVKTMIAEGGFSRGWTWARLKRTGKSDGATFLCTSFAFSTWQVSAATLDTDFRLPTRNVLIYLINKMFF